MTPFIVTNLDDSGDGSLRKAIEDANANMGADTITFSVTGTNFLSSELPAITGELAIDGPGATSLTINGNNSFRVFLIESGATVTISGLTIRNGHAASGEGGGILNEGTLAVTNSVVSGNSAEGPGIGGGILNRGALTITNSTVSGNSASGGGGIENRGTLTITNSTVSGNSASGGGGIGNGGTLTIINSTVSLNVALVGGGIGNGGRLTITKSTISGNSGGDGGGGILNGLGSLTVNIKNSIVANSLSGGDCWIFTGTINAFGTNFDSDSTCPGFTHKTPAELNLGPLALNAPGTTATHALGPESVAIDAVTDCTEKDGTTPVTTD